MMKLKTTHAIALGALTLLASPSVWASRTGSQTTLKVSGTIRPNSCTVTLGDSGEASYGYIDSAQILDTPEGTDLGRAPTISLTIDCGNEPTQMGVSLTDNVADSRVDGLKMGDIPKLTFHSDDDFFGLGMSNGKKVGAYMVVEDNAAVNGIPSNLGIIHEGGTAVSKSYSDQPLWSQEWSDRRNVVTWVRQGNKGDNPPVTGTLFTSNLIVRAAVNQASELDLSKDVQLAGNATLTIHYL
jgi:type 1 fimbria pilin